LELLDTTANGQLPVLVCLCRGTNIRTCVQVHIFSNDGAPPEVCTVLLLTALASPTTGVGTMTAAVNVDYVNVHGADEPFIDCNGRLQPTRPSTSSAWRALSDILQAISLAHVSGENTTPNSVSAVDT
jgi:hypothetical protein